MPMTESEFRKQGDAALERLNRALDVVSEKYDAEVMLQNGVLTIEVDEPTPGKMVISPNAPVRQIWVSAMSRSYKLAWSPLSSQFELDGETLDALLARLVHQFLGN